MLMNYFLKSVFYVKSSLHGTEVSNILCSFQFLYWERCFKFNFIFLSRYISISILGKLDNRFTCDAEFSVFFFLFSFQFSYIIMSNSSPSHYYIVLKYIYIKVRIILLFFTFATHIIVMMNPICKLQSLSCGVHG
jgi:hypothetical protein